MPATFANTQVAGMKDGIPYANAVPLTTTEADLNNAVPGSQGSPISVRYNEALLAQIVLTISGSISTNKSYVILQTSIDGGATWFDVAGILWTGTTGSATFNISAGVAGAAAFQQTRAVGSAPSANFANQIALGGQIRFVGSASTTSSSSSSSSSSGPSTITQVTATINFRFTPLT